MAFSRRLWAGKVGTSEKKLGKLGIFSCSAVGRECNGSVLMWDRCYVCKCGIQGRWYF